MLTHLKLVHTKWFNVMKTVLFIMMVQILTLKFYNTCNKTVLTVCDVLQTASCIIFIDLKLDILIYVLS